MRLGVLDIGSNTGHLLVVDADAGSAPLPAYSFKEPLRLAEHLDDDGAVVRRGVEALTDFCRGAVEIAAEKGCQEMLAFATSAVRDSVNSDEVLAEVAERTGVQLEVLSGEDEARLTFLAVRRWFGWSAGRLMLFDIGGGSLEIANGTDEAPDVAQSLPLGAARLATTWFRDAGLAPASAQGPRPDADQIKELRLSIRAAIATAAGQLLRPGTPDRAAATSKTFRSLARICGAAASGEGPLVPRTLEKAALEEWIPKLMTMGHEELATLPGVSPSRTHQIVPGALVAEACMDIFDLPVLEVCPWALREGIILERLDQMSVVAPRVSAPNALAAGRG